MNLKKEIRPTLIQSLQQKVPVFVEKENVLSKTVPRNFNCSTLSISFPFMDVFPLLNELTELKEFYQAV